MSIDPQTIAEAEARLAALERERRTTLATLARLRAASATACPGEELHRHSARMSAAEKVALFRRFFRDRDDVYPRLWEN